MLAWQHGDFAGGHSGIGPTSQAIVDDHLMKPWEVLGRTRAPDGTELSLTRHASEYLILANRQILMSSRMHGSEDALAVIGCDRARTLTRPSVLVAGLGMGFTLRAALDLLPSTAFVLVAELIPAVLEWNRGPLGPLANHPLEDPRVRVEEGDVAAAMRSNPHFFDAVLLDVDNGPAALTASSNAGLYGSRGVSLARASLKPDGVLAVWSARNDRRFTERLRAGGFNVLGERVKSGVTKAGTRHTILLASNARTTPASLHIRGPQEPAGPAPPPPARGRDGGARRRGVG
jgi:spermidine synthase